jgi:hypothetical protein
LRFPFWLTGLYDASGTWKQAQIKSRWGQGAGLLRVTDPRSGARLEKAFHEPVGTLEDNRMLQVQHKYVQTGPFN